MEIMKAKKHMPILEFQLLQNSLQDFSYISRASS